MVLIISNAVFLFYNAHITITADMVISLPKYKLLQLPLSSKNKAIVHENPVITYCYAPLKYTANKVSDNKELLDLIFKVTNRSKIFVQVNCFKGQKYK